MTYKPDFYKNISDAKRDVEYYEKKIHQAETSIEKLSLEKKKDALKRIQSLKMKLYNTQDRYNKLREML